MNQLTGIVTHIQQSGSIMLVDVDIDGHDVSALMINSLEIPNWLCEEKSIGVIFKETEVSIGKDVRGKISLRNRFLAFIKANEVMLSELKEK